MTIHDAFTEFAFSKDWSPASRIWYRKRLMPFFAWLESQGITDLGAITAPLVRRYVDERRTTPTRRTGRPIDSHTLHGDVRAIRAFLHWAVAEDEVDAKVPARIALPKKEQKVLRVLSGEQIARLFHAADARARSGETPERVARNKAILAVLLDTGIRADELCSLQVGDAALAPDESYLFVRKAKGRKQREVPLGKKSRQLLARYLHRYRGTKQSAAPLFLGKGDAPLTPSGLDQVLYSLVDEAGREYFEGLKLGAHLYRHTFAVNYLQAGGDVYRLSRLMGHSTISTTEGYLRAFTARQARQGGISPLDALGA